MLSMQVIVCNPGCIVGRYHTSLPERNIEYHSSLFEYIVVCPGVSHLIHVIIQFFGFFIKKRHFLPGLCCFSVWFSLPKPPNPDVLMP